MTMPETRNIAVDARWISPSPSGISVYTRELMRRLPAYEPGWRWHFLFNNDAVMRDVERQCAFPQTLKVRFHLLPYGPLSLKSQFLLPKFLRGIGCDLFHSPSFMVPYSAFGSLGRLMGGSGNMERGCGRCITTIHDAIPLIVSDYAPRSATSRMRWIYRECLRFSIRVSAFTITGSEASRRDIVSVLGLQQRDRDSIRTIYDGVSDAFSPGADSGSTPGGKRKRGDSRLVLYVGRLDPYKNVPALVDAFAMLRHDSGLPLHLMILGPEDARYPEARHHAEYRGIREHVTFMHDATDAELLAAYRDADVFVNPSRYEGFGLPMLEAMRCGTPVICTDGGSQPEVAGGAAEIVPAGDVNALAAAMRGILEDEARARELSSRGLRRSAAFSWEATASQTAALYREAMG